MIIGAKYWDQPFSYEISQRGNALYYVSNKAYNEGRVGWTNKLRWCGPSQAALLFSLMKGYKWLSDKCMTGETRFQPEDIIGLWFHEKSNFQLMREIDPAFDNEQEYANYWMKFYPLMSHKLFKIRGTFIDGQVMPVQFKAILQEGGTVQLCLKDPGHYIGVGAYDTERKTYHCYDTWPERAGGWRFEMNYSDIVSQCIPAGVLYENTA
jgi:hypothetical protein